MESPDNDSSISTSRISWRGVMALLAGVASQMLCWGLIMTYGTILAFYTRYFIPDVKETLVALAGAIPPFCLLFLALPWGRLLDAGHHQELNILAGIMLTGGMVGLAFTGSDDYNSGKYWAIVLASIPMGIGQSIYFLAAPQCAKTWFPEHKGLAMGITNSGAALGGVMWPLIFNTLVDQFGFRIGVATLAGISGTLCVFIALCGRPLPDSCRRAIGKDFSIRNWWPTRAFHSNVFCIHTAAMCFIYLGILTIPFFLELWARRSGDIGVSEDTRDGFGVDDDGSRQLEEYLLVTLNACQLPGRLLGSSLCDKIRARKIHAVACFVAVTIIGSFWFTTSSYQVGMLFAALFGLTLGVMVSLPINDAQDLLGHNRTHLLGQYAGAVYTCASPFILSGAIGSGALVSQYDVYVAPAIWCMVCFSLGGGLITLSLWIKDDTYLLDHDATAPESRTVSPNLQQSDEEKHSLSPANRPRAATGTSVASSATAVSSVTDSEEQYKSTEDEKCHVCNATSNLSRTSTWSDTVNNHEKEDLRIPITRCCNTIHEEPEPEPLKVRTASNEHVGFEIDLEDQRVCEVVQRQQDRKWSWTCPESPV